jgi:hypothetical protein
MSTHSHFQPNMTKADLYSDLEDMRAQRDILMKALRRIENGVENNESFSGTTCADIAREAIAKVEAMQ